MNLLLMPVLMFSFLQGDGHRDELARSYAARNDFALRLHRNLCQEDPDGNAFHSPNSVWTALALLTEGAEGESARRLLSHLGPRGRDGEEGGIASLHRAAADLRARLASASAHVTVKSANAIWGQRGEGFVPAVVNSLEVNYAAKLEELDFTLDPDASRKRINAWVSEQTKDRIEELLPEGSVSDLTRLVLTNAVYFLGDWDQPFDPNLTRVRDFTKIGGDTLQVPFVQVTDARPIRVASFGPEGEARPFDVEAADGFFAVELPYAGDRISFVALCPAQHGGLADLEAQFDADLLVQVCSKLEPQRLRFAMPKFELQPAYDLKGALGRMGFEHLFAPETAGLGGFAAGSIEDLFVTGAFHKSFLCVDEQGTEAAAATGMVVGVRSMPRPAPELALDRPFLFLIRERESGAILFMGRLTQPD